MERGGAVSEAPVGKAQLWLPGEETEEGTEAHTSAGSRRSGAQGLGGRRKGRGRADPGGGVHLLCQPGSGRGPGGFTLSTVTSTDVVSETTEGVARSGQRYAAQQSSGLAVPRARLKRTSQGGGQV